MEEWARKKFWEIYQRLVFVRYYYEAYKIYSARIDRAIKIFLCAVSLAGIGSLWFWSSFNHAWKLILAFAQLLSAISYMLPYSKQVQVLDLLLPDLEYLINQVDRDWDAIDSMSSSAINDLVFQYQNRLSDMENKYVGTTLFPDNRHCIKIAENKKKKFNYQRFDIVETISLKEEEKNAQRKHK